MPASTRSEGWLGGGEGGVGAGLEREVAVVAAAGFFEQVPGVVVLGVEAAVVAFGGIKVDREASADGAEGDEVPGFFKEDVEGHEVDFMAGIGFGAAEGASGMNLVEAVRPRLLVDLTWTR